MGIIPTSDQYAFSRLLRRHRQAAELTQEGLAELAGLSVRGISDLERGVNRAPYLATVARIADALHLSDADRAELESTIARRRGPARDRPIRPLPQLLTPLLGREREVASVIHLLRWEGRRLLTLTGPGGVGKTRLALHAATMAAEDYADGATFVSLEEVIDAGAVEPKIATIVGVRDQPGRSIHEALVDYLHDRELLLVLDGFEQLLPAGPLTVQLLLACPKLKILVTSRSPLHLSGEQELDVKPLAIPAADQDHDVERLLTCPSVALFIQRAQRVLPDFAVTVETAAAVAEICRRLDGLPLAIELAAARAKTLPPNAFLAVLRHRLQVLTDGPRDAQPRQQTMRHTIAWSYDLLDAASQTLFRRLAVFNTTFGVEAAGALSPDPATWSATLGDISVLADSSLLVVDRSGTEPRFSMLETVRAYGLELLDQKCEGDAVRLRLADYCLSLVETAEAELQGANQATWLDRLEHEHPTLLLILDWARRSGNLLVGLRIAGALWRFWYARGYRTVGRRQLENLLQAAGEGNEESRSAMAKAFRGAAVLAAVQGEYASAGKLGEQGLQLYRQLADSRGEAAILVILGSVSQHTGDYARAWTCYTESLSLFRAAGDRGSTSIALNNLGNIAHEQGRIAEADALYEESLSIKRELGDTRGIAVALNNLATLALNRDDLERATRLGEEALGMLRTLGDQEITSALDTVSRTALRRGDARRAAALYAEGVKVSFEVGGREQMALCLEGAGQAAGALRAFEAAGVLLGSAEALRITLGTPIAPTDMEHHAHAMRAVQEALGLERFHHVWNRGTHLDLQAAVDFAGDYEHL